MSTPPPLTIEEVKKKYEEGFLTYYHAIDELMKRGMTEEAAESLIGEWMMSDIFGRGNR